MRGFLLIAFALSACAPTALRPESLPNVVAARGATQTSAPASSSPHASADPLLDAVGHPELTTREREEWGALASESMAPCASLAVSVAECVVDARPCATCARAARALLAMVRAGVPHDGAAALYAARFDAKALRDAPIGRSPTRGPADAPVTLVVFSDFECPACAAVWPAIDRLMERRPGKVRVVYKAIALPQHTHAEVAARAALAADAQGKFWEMHAALFAHQRALEVRDIAEYAHGLGLDMRTFAAAINGPVTITRFVDDAKLAEALHVDHTPFVLVNGRAFVEAAGPLEDWVDDALAR